MSQENEKLGPPWTTLKILRWTEGYFAKNEIDNPRFEAELLLAHALGMQRIMLYANYERALQPDELNHYRAMVKRRAAQEPVAYITGTRGFWTIELNTDARALIPRPDTEALVSRALDYLPKGSTARVVDVGTGTGAVALALATERPDISVLALDVSAEALSLARENTERLELTSRLTLIESDLLGALPAGWEDVDVIVSNPPYVGLSEKDVMGEEVKMYEPELALYAGEDGLDVIHKLVPQAHAALRDGGWFLCEIGYTQGKRVKAIFEQHGFQNVQITKDLSQHERVVAGQRSGAAS